MRRAIVIGQPPRVTFPILAVLFAFYTLGGWRYTLAVPPDFSTPPELLERLFKGTLLALSTGAVVGLWSGAPWLKRMMGAWYAVLVGWQVAQPLALYGAEALARGDVWANIAAVAGFAYLPVLHVRTRLDAALASLQRVPAVPRAPRWIP